MKNIISIICPFYNEKEVIPIFYNKVLKILSELKSYNFELIFVNNASEDDSLECLKELIAANCDQNVKIKIISFTRNFGYQKSLLAGYKFSTGDASIVVDVDLEDPPELILQFLEKWSEGYEVVYGKRLDRNENFVIKKLRNVFYKILILSADYKSNYQMAEFCLISRKVRELIIQINTTFIFFRSEIAFLGFKTFAIEYKRDKRAAGKTKYNIFGMIKFAIAGFLTTSTFFLRFFAYTFPVILCLNFFLLIFAEKISILIFINFTYLFLNLSFISLYIARIYQIMTNRSSYIIDYEKSKL
jgi:dolichol-phosphate mannosyltransferase